MRRNKDTLEKGLVSSEPTVSRGAEPWITTSSPGPSPLRFFEHRRGEGTGDEVAVDHTEFN